MTTPKELLRDAENEVILNALGVELGTKRAIQIVRAVNAHADLVAACKMVLLASEDNGDMEDIGWAMLRAALAKAGEAVQT